MPRRPRRFFYSHMVKMGEKYKGKYVTVRTFRSKAHYDRWRHYIFGVIYRDKKARKLRKNNKKLIHIKNIEDAKNIDLRGYTKADMKREEKQAEKSKNTIWIEDSKGKKKIEVPLDDYKEARNKAIENLAKIIADNAVRENIYEADFLGMEPISLWERDFLASIYDRGLTWYDMSEKQKAVLRRIAEKYVGSATYVNGKIKFAQVDTRDKYKYIEEYTPKTRAGRTLRDIINPALVNKKDFKVKWYTDNLVVTERTVEIAPKKPKIHHINIHWMTSKYLGKDDFKIIMHEGGFYDHDKKTYKAYVDTSYRKKVGKTLFDIRATGYDKEKVEKLVRKKIELIKKYEEG